MFKFRRPMTIIVSSGGLLLLTLGSLLLISNAAVHTDEINSTSDQQQQAKLNQDDNLTPTTPPITILESGKVGNITSRGRSGRYLDQDGSRPQLDQHQQQSQYQQQGRSMSMESYAAALAAANSAADHSSGSPEQLVQSTIPANDAASFGEQPPAASPAARQFEATEYSPVHSTSGSYYVASSSAASPTSTSSATGYSPSYSSSGYHHYSPHSSSSGYSNHHQQQQQQYYQSAPSTYGHHHHYGAASKKVSASLSPPLGYPSYDYWSGSPSYLADRNAAAYMSPHWGSSFPHTTTSSGFGSSLMSSASSALSHFTGGFGISEIICGVIALSIGAVILGAPFFLIYLALMGNFSGSSTLSLTNPTATGQPGAAGGTGTTTVNGRRKRLAIFEPATISNFINGGDFDQSQLQLSALADSIIGQLSPFVDLKQVTATFKKLVDSIEKYSKMNNQRPGKKLAATAPSSSIEMGNRKRRE